MSRLRFVCLDCGAETKRRVNCIDKNIFVRPSMCDKHDKKRRMEYLGKGKVGVKNMKTFRKMRKEARNHEDS